jgi:CBS domain-containing protein
MICRTDVVAVSPQDDLAAAARLMRTKHVGYLVVVEPIENGNAQKVIGVLTDRDIVVAVVACDVDPHTLTVGDTMSAKPFVARETDSVEATVGHMRVLGIRRVPVVGTAGQLKGILSFDDVLDSLASQMRNVADLIRNEQRTERAARS